MIDAKCENCVFYVTRDFNGECRKNPPRIIAKPEEGWTILELSLFPEVEPSCFCGEFAVLSEGALIKKFK